MYAFKAVLEVLDSAFFLAEMDQYFKNQKWTKNNDNTTLDQVPHVLCTHTEWGRSYFV